MNESGASESGANESGDRDNSRSRYAGETPAAGAAPVTDTRPRVELYYSYRSPYSYLAIGRLKRWAEAERVDIAIRPVLPLAVRDPAFFDQVNPLFVPYLMHDTQRVAEYLGVPFIPKVVDIDPFHGAHRPARAGAARGAMRDPRLPDGGQAPQRTRRADVPHP